MITLTAGTAFIMWLGEQITERGIGNGISLIIFAGIVVAHARRRSCSTFELVRTDEFIAAPGADRCSSASWSSSSASIVFVERGQRRIPSSTRKRVVGRRMYGGQTHATCRCKVNTAGVIPPIFASSLLMFPAHDRPVHRARRRCRASSQTYLHAGRLALQRCVYVGADHLLLLLLHGGHVQPGRRRRQHQEVGRLHPGHPAGQADGRVHRPRPHRASRSAARSTSRRSACCRRSCSTQLRRAVLLRRHRAADRGRRRARHRRGRSRRT